MRLLSCANMDEPSAPGASAPPGVLGNHELAVELDAALLDLVEDDLEGHDLRHARRRELLVGGLLEQDRAGIGVEQDRVRGECLEALRLRGRVHEDREDRKCGQPYSRLGWQAGKGQGKRLEPTHTRTLLT